MTTKEWDKMLISAFLDGQEMTFANGGEIEGKKKEDFETEEKKDEEEQEEKENRFLVFCDDVEKIEIAGVYVFDTEKKTIQHIHNGNRIDVTKEAQKLYNQQVKKDDWYNAKLGATWYRALVDGNASALSGSFFKQVFFTSSEREINRMIFKLQINQIERKIRINEKYQIEYTI